MYELIEKKLSTLENAELRYSLEQAFRALSDRQDRISNELMERLVREKSSSNKGYDEKWTVATVLVKVNEIPKYAVEGFSVINVGKCFYKKQDVVDLGLENSNTSNQSQRQFFLDIEYGDWDKYLNRTFEGDGFKYQICINERFVKKEAELFKVCAMYGINMPVIFSPWARRAIDIRIEEGKVPKSVDGVSLRLKENGLEKVLLIDSFLLWNFTITKGLSPSSQRVAPFENRNMYIKHFDEGINENDFLYTDEQIEAIQKTADLTEIRSCNGEKNCYTKYRINSIGEVVLNCFCNTFLDTLPARIRTKSDMIGVLQQFNNRNYACTFVGTDKDESFSLFPVYRTVHSYHTDKNQIFYQKRRGLTESYVKFFVGNGDKKYLCDYANYVLHYLQSRYPEYVWLGVE